MREVEAGRRQQCAGLLGRHRQLTDPEHEQLALRTQACEGQDGGRSRGQRELGACRDRTGELAEQVKRLPRVELLDVVQHQHRPDAC